MILFADSEGPDQTARIPEDMFSHCVAQLPDNQFVFLDLQVQTV